MKLTKNEFPRLLQAPEVFKIKQNHEAIKTTEDTHTYNFSFNEVLPMLLAILTATFAICIFYRNIAILFEGVNANMCKISQNNRKKHGF